LQDRSALLEEIGQLDVEGMVMGSFDFATHRPVLAGQRSPGRSAFLERDRQQRVCNGLSLTPKTDSLPNVRFRGTPSAGAGQKRKFDLGIQLPQLQTFVDLSGAQASSGPMLPVTESPRPL
jgi:hypothetical protein